ncbi:DUF192 domain-containing protein [Sphingobium lignivorans]|uniref:DUF192 domain-containing protein n=1 Tax=Sphingobium lignivorans TaxID=2735886 RepID=A0ABR6NFU8_9SPHN|nr:DUF192 domain-containing protein [Sphingobium lignivorans]MBB5986159.1 hypothetical protein [Sphingobium lignivorans]
MKRNSWLWTASLALLIAATGCRGDAPATPDDGPEVAPTTREGEVQLRITTVSGDIRRFQVELAVDDASQQRGLMERTHLGPDAGMLFPYPYPVAASFWMKNTPLPLDLIFIRPDGTIAAILPGEPNDLTPLSAGEAVSGVLEVNRGRAEALGVAPGDKVSWGNCDEAPPAANAWRADRFCPGETE